MAPQGSRTGFAARIRRCRVDRGTAVLGAAGAVAGRLCGLLGVAGGVVIVPVLTSRRIGMTRARQAARRSRRYFRSPSWLR
jgi:uncharacterized membrane protein YfcA